MASADSVCYTLINPSSEAELATEQQLKAEIEDVKGTDKSKAAALKKLIIQTLNGDKFSPTMAIHVIKYLLPSQDHYIKKLLLIYWEIAPKVDEEGKLRHEMILVCDAYRRDLMHPNEFIRGSTLRFLCKLKQPELLEPLMEPIRSCLEHRHSYVRRNAVLAIKIIYDNFPHLISDAPEVMSEYLASEKDASCKRNAFMMLIQCDRNRALAYLETCIDQVHSFNDILQLVIVELVYKVCRSEASQRGRFIRCVYNLLQSSSNAVRYEAAWTLTTMSSAPTAIKAAAACYVELIIKESDNNVKIIVLDRLTELKEQHERVLQDMVMDILRALSSPDLDVREKTLNLTLDLVSSRNVVDLVKFLEKEVQKSASAQGTDDNDKYRQLLVQTLHNISVRFPDIATQVIPVLMDFLSDSNELAAGDVTNFVREAIQRYSELKPLIISKLLEVFPSIRNLKIIRSILWILGEYCDEHDSILDFMIELRKSIGDVPIVAAEIRKAAGEEEEQPEGEQSADPAPKKKSGPRVTADGTYITQSALVSEKSKQESNAPPLRNFLLEGEFGTGSVLATTLTKLGLRFTQLTDNNRKRNAFLAECMLIMTSVLHLGRSGYAKKPIAEDDACRIVACIKVLSNPKPQTTQIFAVESRNSLSTLLASKAKYQKHSVKKEKKITKIDQPDEPISFAQLMVRDGSDALEDELQSSLMAAVSGGQSNQEKQNPLSSRLNKVLQLTGFSDPVYAEAYVHVNQYDIVLDVLVVNQTPDTLQSVTLELATLGDLKLVEKPTPLTLAPHDFANIKASVKVTSTENAIIFGNIVYDITGSQSDRNCVVLNDIKIDIMDYIQPAFCSDQEFREMWSAFEWENKVTVHTNIGDLREYLLHLVGATNMKCLTPEQTMSGNCEFLAANLYAKSMFGESALANLSIEVGKNGFVLGHIRIRAKSQGMAISLGDKINDSQKKT
ncbi:unnamed protein product [Oikopleura dioica]|uniref:Coatomer subunit beta n=1 Tax=Oikopleura dioica TaxID=34765 RepID=E4XMI9_OIKDI|nr:unnamed protein product [Oikopleura dioica]